MATPDHVHLPAAPAPEHPLDSLSAGKLNQALVDIAEQIKEAVEGAPT